MHNVTLNIHSHAFLVIYDNTVMFTLEMGLSYKQQIQILLSSRHLQNFKKMNLYHSPKQHMW